MVWISDANSVGTHTEKWLAHRFLALSLGTLLAISFLAGVGYTSSVAADSSQTVRAIIQSDSPAKLEELKAELEVKHDFGSLGFSAIVSLSKLEELQKRPDITARKALEYEPAVLERPEGELKAVQQRKEYLRPNVVPPNIVRVHAPEVWEEADGKGVNIAFIDTGLDIEHPDIKDSVFMCVDVTQSTFSLTDTTIRDIRDGECTDYVGHGTHVAGIAAANGGADGLGIKGVAPGAGIGMAKVCPGFICLEDDIAAGILLAAERGADVISISLGGDEPSPITHEAIKAVVSQGIVVVAAAGNSGPGEDTIVYPGAHPEVIAVAATENLTAEPTSEDEIYTRVTDFSSRGITDGDDSTISEREVELAAPGRRIFSTCDGAFDAFVNGYCSLSGTSMATPHVAGVVALIIQKIGPEDMDSAEDVEFVRSVWISNVGVTTFDITEDGYGHAEKGYDIASGYGMPEMDRIFDYLEAPGQSGARGRS